MKTKNERLESELHDERARNAINSKNIVRSRRAKNKHNVANKEKAAIEEEERRLKAGIDEMKRNQEQMLALQAENEQLLNDLNRLLDEKAKAVAADDAKKIHTLTAARNAEKLKEQAEIASQTTEMQRLLNESEAREVQLKKELDELAKTKSAAMAEEGLESRLQAELRKQREIAEQESLERAQAQKKHELRLAEDSQERLRLEAEWKTQVDIAAEEARKKAEAEAQALAEKEKRLQVEVELKRLQERMAEEARERAKAADQARKEQEFREAEQRRIQLAAEHAAAQALKDQELLRAKERQIQLDQENVAAAERARAAEAEEQRRLEEIERRRKTE